MNQALAEWSRRKLHMPDDCVWYVPNFACADRPEHPYSDLPGLRGNRIVCVANLRPQKDHLMLLAAMSLVVEHVPDAHLLLVGGASNAEHFKRIEAEINRRHLNSSVSVLGERRDVAAILDASDVGVLSSASEGLPLALIEYGMARLAVAATAVGQCRDVLDEGRAGRLTPPHDHVGLARALVQLLRSPEQRAALGGLLYRRVQEFYSPRAGIEKICRVYETVLGQ